MNRAVELTAHDFGRLARLRDAFLAARGRSPWRERRDLEVYDATFAQRIAWKWSAVLDELVLRGFTPPAGPLVDWGAGTGIAARTWIARFGAPDGGTFAHDASPLAAAFARERITAEHAHAGVRDAEPPARPGVLLLSHLIEELAPQECDELVLSARGAQCIVWVEPGHSSASRALGAVRDALLDTFDVVAPCTHRERCPALASVGDWCHFFAKPPADVFTRGDWARFGTELGIDLRSVPYSFVVLRARASAAAPLEPAPPAHARVLGRARAEKGHVRFQACDANGLHQFRALDRDDRELVKRLEKLAGECAIYAFEAENGRVRRATPWPPRDGNAAPRG